jgi:predicted ATPase
VVVEETATDVIALSNALGHAEPWRERAFIDKVMALQRQRQNSVRAAGSATVFFDRSPVCTLALSRHLSFGTSRLLTREVDRLLAEWTYEMTVFLIRNETGDIADECEQSPVLHSVAKSEYRGSMALGMCAGCAIFGYIRLSSLFAGKKSMAIR